MRKYLAKEQNKKRRLLAKNCKSWGTRFQEGWGTLQAEYFIPVKESQIGSRKL